MKIVLKVKDTIETNPKNFSQDLDLYVKYNEKVEDALNRLNEYRGPNNQIKKIYNKFGQEIPLSHKIKGDNTFFYDLTLPN